MIEVPDSFREMPRWWRDGQGWLDALPDLVAAQTLTWGLDLDGDVRHGSNALVVPVRRDGQRLVLRMLPPGDDVVAESSALRFWAGRGTVLILDTDVSSRAMLLERLDSRRSLQSLPLPEALVLIGRLLRRLAVPAPEGVRATGEVVAEDLATMERRWAELDRPLPRWMLDRALASAAGLTVAETPDLAVNGDLHFEQVLAGDREPWLAVDPVLLRGDVGYDLGRIMWSRVDELASPDDIRRGLALTVRAAELDDERSVDWVVYRAASYLLWGIDYGLTIDPPRCRRLLDALTTPPRSS